jgi:outer membrane receptor protein involved in Fe transport
MPGVAARRGSLQLHVPVSARLSVSVAGAYTGSRRFEGDFDDAFGRQEGHFLLDAKVAWQAGATRLFVDVKNVLDQEYDEYGVIGGFPSQRAFYPSPGVHAFAGVEVGF